MDCGCISATMIKLFCWQLRICVSQFVIFDIFYCQIWANSKMFCLSRREQKRKYYRATYLEVFQWYWNKYIYQNSTYISPHRGAMKSNSIFEVYRKAIGFYWWAFEAYKENLNMCNKWRPVLTENLNNCSKSGISSFQCLSFPLSFDFEKKLETNDHETEINLLVNKEKYICFCKISFSLFRKENAMHYLMGHVRFHTPMPTMLSEVINIETISQNDNLYILEIMVMNTV